MCKYSHINFLFSSLAAETNPIKRGKHTLYLTFSDLVEISSPLDGVNALNV